MSDVGGEDLSPNDAHAVLERFVVDNDELLELEERIGRFNIFDALGVARAEIRHSNFLSWLLDPNESHGQGALFLTAILMDLLKEAREAGFNVPVSPIELDGEDLRGVEVRREWRHIDLLIRCGQPPFVIAIENKVDAGEHGDQLQRYQGIVQNYFADLSPLYVYLTHDGRKPSERDWISYTYADIHRVLTRVCNAGRGAIGDDVGAFLEHYLRLIGSRFMNDPKIDELCQRIYKNHRQAIDLIVERGQPQFQELAAIVRETASKQDWLRVYEEGGASVFFMPREWLDLLPKIRQDPSAEESQWFCFQLYFTERALQLYFYACPTTDQDIRRRVIERLVRDRSEFGLELARKSIPEKWATIRYENPIVVEWEDEPDEETVIIKTAEWLEQLKSRLARVPDVLRPIIEEWEKSQAR